LSNRAITRVLAVIIIVIVVAAVAAGAYLTTLSGLGPGPTTSSVIPNLDTIVVDTIGQPEHMDPVLDPTPYVIPVIQNLYEGLVFFRGDRVDQVIPWLAQSWDVSPDGLTYTFHLRSGIKFHDGTPFDANAVYYSTMRLMIIDDPGGNAWMLNQVLRGGMNYSKQYNNAGPSAPNGYGDQYTQAELDDLLNAKPVEVIDPMTVAFHLEQPYGGFLFMMTSVAGFVVSPTAYTANWNPPTDGRAYIKGITAGDYNDELFPWGITNAVGTGPYTLKSWDRSTQTVVLARNENYWGGPDNRGIAPVANVIIKGVDDPNTRILDFKGGSADLLGWPVSILSQLSGGLVFQFADEDTWFTQHKLVSTSPDYQLFPQEGLWSTLNTRAIGFNQEILGPDGEPQAFQPFADIRIRKAFILAFNRTSYLHDVLQDFGVVATQILPPGMLGYDPSIQPTPCDPATAKNLLLEAGASPVTPDNAFSAQNPKSVEFEYALGDLAGETAGVLLANTINSFASETGLYVKITGIAISQYRSLMRHRQHNIVPSGWYVDYPDADDFLAGFVTGTLAHFVAAYNNPDATALLKQQASIVDTNQRAQAIVQIEHIVNDDWAWLWLNYGASFSISRSWIHERPNPTVASGINTYNPMVNCYFFYELQKGGSTLQSLFPTFLAELQLPTTTLSLRKVFWNA